MRRRSGAAVCMVITAALASCGEDAGGPTAATISAPATTAPTTPTTAPSTSMSTTTTATGPVVTDPQTTVVTLSGLLCADEWYAGTSDFVPGFAGHDSLGDAIDTWWRSEGVGLGWIRDELEPTLDEDGRTTRYLTATGRPVLVLIAEEFQSGGWAIGASEGCSED